MRFTGRIETPELLDAVDTRDFQIEHCLALLGRQAAHQVNEFFIGLSLKALGQGFRVLPQGNGQLLATSLGQPAFPWRWPTGWSPAY